MKITVKLYAVLQIGRFEQQQISFPAGSRIADVVAFLNLPPEHVDILLVNGVHAVATHELIDGDVLSILPMVEGG